MQLGMIGLGRMGANMVRRLMKGGHECVVFDVTPANIEALEKEGATGARTIKEFVSKLAKPRHAWVMVPLQAVESTVQELMEVLEPGDTIIDGGNSFFKDDVRRSLMVGKRGINYVDVGTSGGVWGLERGYCMMIGGKKEAVDRLNPVFETLAPGMGDIPRTPRPSGLNASAEKGYLHCGLSGSGHFVKMVHNGIEYGLMQAYAEGFDLMQNAGKIALEGGQKFEFNVADIAEVWRRGSVVGSWLLDLTALALAEDGKLDGYSGHVEDTGEGRWTVNAAIETAVPLPCITASLFTRFRSREKSSFAEKMLSAMRFKFGGHVEKK